MTVKRIINILILVTTATCSMQAAASVRKKMSEQNKRLKKFFQR